MACSKLVHAANSSPIFRRKYLLTKAEQSFYEILREIARDQFVFAKVRLADLIDADDRHRCWQANFNRVRGKHIDFVVCDSLFRPRVAVELDDASHEREDRRERDYVVDRLFDAVRLPLARFPVRKKYDHDEIRHVLLTKLNFS